MRQLPAGFLLILLSTGLAAGTPFDAPFNPLAIGGYGDFLPPDQAFQLQAYAIPGATILVWRIANGYYLYRKRLKIKVTNGDLENARFPPGEMVNDPNFGRVEIYRHQLRVKLTYTTAPTDKPVQLAVTYQGCADGGLCYPAITRQLKVRTIADAGSG